MKHLAWILILLAGGSASADEQTVRCREAVVVSVSGPASDVGAAVLRDGGNAIDGAVATALALAVTHPAAGNIGGGGYLLVMPRAGKPLVFDFREVAPAASTQDMFVDKAQRTPHRRVGVPGTVRGLWLAHLRLGKLPWRELVAPAVGLAREGFALDEATARSLNELLASSDKQRFRELHLVYGKTDESPWRAGDRLVQADLANTLERIAEDGPDGFYSGDVADKIVREMRSAGGLITHKDLQDYRAVVRTPLKGTYRGFEIYTVPPSSSGGTTLIEALNIMECFESERDRQSPAQVHRMVEAMKRAYRDRAQYLGDPTASEIPRFLLEKSYARKLAATIGDKATLSRE